MNAILSLLLSFAMLFSGGALPATANTAATLAIEDFCVELNGESYPLGFDVSVTAAAGENELLLHFEAEDDGEVLLPVTGKINPDSATFSISDTGSAFTFPIEVLDEALDLEEADAAEIEAVAQYMSEYASMLYSLAENPYPSLTPETGTAVLDVFHSAMQDLQIEETNWDFGSGNVPAVHITGHMDGNDLFAVLDGWLALEDETLSPMLQYMLNIYNMVFSASFASGTEITNLVVDSDAASVGIIGGADGPTAIYTAGDEDEFVPAENFTELISMLAGEEAEAVREVLSNVLIDVDMTTAESGDQAYAQVGFNVAMDESAATTMAFNLEVFSEAESTETSMYMSMNAEDQIASIETYCTVDGPMNDPASVAMDMLMQIDSRTDYTDYSAENSSEAVIYTTQSAFISSVAECGEGAKDLFMQMDFTESSTEYIDGEIVNDDLAADVVSIALNADQENNADGSLATDVALTIEVPEQFTAGVSFLATLSKAPVKDYFAGMETVALTMDEEDPAYQTLTIDAMDLMSDATRIAADEEFMAFVSMMEGDFGTGDVYYESESTSEEEIHNLSGLEYTDGFEEVEYLNFETLEEAAEVYTGIIPAYTAPEGYTLQYATASSDGSYLELEYSTDKDDYFLVDLYSYGDYYDDTVYTISDGAIVPLEEMMVTLYGENDLYYSASVQKGDVSLSFYFGNDLTIDAVAPILAGLE